MMENAVENRENYLAQSTGLNIIEHVWSFFKKQKFFKTNPSTVDELGHIRKELRKNPQDSTHWISQKTERSITQKHQIMKTSRCYI